MSYKFVAHKSVRYLPWLLLLIACGGPQTDSSGNAESSEAWAAVERSAAVSGDTPMGAGRAELSGNRPPCPRDTDAAMAGQRPDRSARRGGMGRGGMGRGGMGRGGMGRGGMGRGGMGRGGMGRGGMGRGGMGRGGGQNGPRNPAIARYDLNGDGRLDDGERAAMRRQQAGNLFARVDDNRDGRITLTELQNACGRLGRRLQSGFAVADSDSDGFLSRHEVESFKPGLKRR